MSLFGNVSSKPAEANSSNIFGKPNTNTPQAQGSSNLFGSTSTSQSAGAGSLFGTSSTAAQSTAPGTSSLFGGLNTAASQAQQPGSSLFGNTTSQTQKPSLFGNIGASKTPQQSNNAATTGSLFGRVQAPAATSSMQTSSLFGNLGSTTQPQQQQPSLFGGLSGQQPAQPNQQPQATQGQDQLHDGQQSSTGNKNPRPGYFDNLLEKGRKRHRDVDGSFGYEELPSLQFGLNDIARRARELGGSVGRPQANGGADSRAHYLLAASGVNPGTTKRDLDGLAIEQALTGDLQQRPDFEPDTRKYLSQLQQQSTLKMISDSLERAHRNFDEYLEESVDIDWDFQRKKIYEHFGLTPKIPQDDDLSSPTGTGAFGKSSRKSRFGKSARDGQSSLNRSIFGQSSVQKSVIGTPGVGLSNGALFADAAEKDNAASSTQDDRFQRDKQRKYAERIQALNQARLRKARSRGRSAVNSYPILAHFQSVEDCVGGDSPKQLADAYRALIQVVGEGKAKERQFGEEYLDEIPNSGNSVRIRKRIIDGSRRSLEQAFYEQLEVMVAKNPKEANLGGIPTVINKVRAYIRIRAARKDLIPDGYDLFLSQNDYCWPLIFFLLRCGFVKEAADYVAENATHFRTFDKNIITYLTEYARSPDRRLERKMQPLCNNIYTSLSKADAIDPYRIACYKIIGRCELSKRSLDNVAQGVEDWIWLQFNLAREVNRAEESAADVFGLDEVRETVREIGLRHFAKGAEGLGGYGTFFYLQILGGMYEQAVSYLYTYSYIAAVHFAIALDYYGLLRVSDFSVSESELLTRNTKELPQINFGRMIGYYTRDFRLSNVEAAVDYLALICLNSDLPGKLGQSQVSLCHEALRELILETREFSRLLGDVRSDGSRIQGAIQERLEIIGLADQEIFLKTVTVEAASVADDNGRTTDAVLLYHLAEDYDNVIAIVNRALSEAIAVDIGQEQLRLRSLGSGVDQSTTRAQQGSSLSLTSVDDPVVLAKNMMALYNNNPLYMSKIKAVNRETCGTLLRMAEAKEKVAARQWIDAITHIKDLQLLPLEVSGSIPAIRASANAFNSFPPAISRNIGPLLLWTITSIGKEREKLASREYGTEAGGHNREFSEKLLVSARDLMVFAGLLKYRLGERVWEAICGVSSDLGVA